MTRKIVVAAVGAALAGSAGLSFYRSRHLAEPVVAGPGVARVARLGDYFEPLKGTVNDGNVYVLEGREPGGTFLLLGGTHPEEPPAGWPRGSSPRAPSSPEGGSSSSRRPTGAPRRRTPPSRAPPT